MEAEFFLSQLPLVTNFHCKLTEVDFWFLKATNTKQELFLCNLWPSQLIKTVFIYCHTPSEDRKRNKRRGVDELLHFFLVTSPFNCKQVKHSSRSHCN